jgi:hypothetical protein
MLGFSIASHVKAYPDIENPSLHSVATQLELFLFTILTDCGSLVVVRSLSIRDAVSSSHACANWVIPIKYV